jgi:hypothetical protein
VDTCLKQDHYDPVRSNLISPKAAFAVVGLIALLPPRAQDLAPNKFLPEIKERARYSEVICSSTIVKITPAGSPVKIQGEDHSQWIALASVDHVFKGTLVPKFIEFKYYGYLPHSGLSEPMADFRPGLRYVLFLKRQDLGFEVAIPAYQMEIQLAPRPATIDESNPEPDRVLAKELFFAIQSAPDTTRGLADKYFSWAEELLGKEAIPLVEPFLNSDDPRIRFSAAWWLSFRKVDATVIDELKKVSQDQSVDESERTTASERLRDMAEGRYLP